MCAVKSPIHDLDWKKKRKSLFEVNKDKIREISALNLIYLTKMMAIAGAFSSLACILVVVFVPVKKIQKRQINYTLIIYTLWLSSMMCYFLSS